MIISPDGAVGEPPTGSERGYGGRQRLQPLLNNRLHDVPARVQEIALHGVHRSVAVALATMQVQTRHELRTMELGFPMADDPDMHEELIEDFDDAAAAIMDITSTQDVINKVFD